MRACEARAAPMAESHVTTRAGHVRPTLHVATPAPYRAPRWLAGGHVQTIWPYFLRGPAVALRRERVDTPDGDFWLFDWLDSPSAGAGTPLVVLFHGLEGSSASHYARALFARLAALGLRGVVPRYRSIRYRGFDQFGQRIEREASGFHARVVQHECDHLDGVLYPQRIRDLRNFGFVEPLTECGVLASQPCDDDG